MLKQRTILAIANLATACFEYYLADAKGTVVRTDWFAELLFEREHDRAIVKLVRELPAVPGSIKQFILDIEPKSNAIDTVWASRIDRIDGSGLVFDRGIVTEQFLEKLAGDLLWHTQRPRSQTIIDIDKRKVADLLVALDQEGFAWNTETILRKDSSPQPLTPESRQPRPPVAPPKAVETKVVETVATFHGKVIDLSGEEALARRVISLVPYQRSPVEDPPKTAPQSPAPVTINNVINNYPPPAPAKVEEEEDSKPKKSKASGFTTTLKKLLTKKLMKPVVGATLTGVAGIAAAWIQHHTPKEVSSITDAQAVSAVSSSPVHVDPPASTSASPVPRASAVALSVPPAVALSVPPVPTKGAAPASPSPPPFTQKPHDPIPQFVWCFDKPLYEPYLCFTTKERCFKMVGSAPCYQVPIGKVIYCFRGGLLDSEHCSASTETCDQLSKVLAGDGGSPQPCYRSTYADGPVGE